MRVSQLLAAISILCACGPSRAPREATIRASIAAGATVTVAAARSCSSTGADVSLCLDRASNEGTIDVQLPANDVLELSGISESDGAVRFSLTARRPGDVALTIRYPDSRGTRTLDAWFRVAEITGSRLDVSCSARSATPIAVSAGSRVPFEVQAFAGETELLTGALALAEAPDFALLDFVSGRSTATAPSRPGTYAWTLAGGGAAEVLVFDPSTLGLSISSEVDTRSKRTAVSVSSTAGGVPTCINEQDTRVAVSVTGPSCVPVLGGVELAGPLPVNLKRSPFVFDLVGDGSPCTVEATLGAQSASQTIVGLVEAPPAFPSPRRFAVGDAGVDLGGTIGPGSTCPNAVSDGKCDPPVAFISIIPIFVDGDCYIDSDWRIEHVDAKLADGGAVWPSGTPVGVGLTTRFHLSVEATTLLGPVYLGPPQNLVTTVQPAWQLIPPGPSAGMRTEALACSNGRAVLAVEPLAPGTHGMTFKSDILDDIGRTEVIAHPVDRVQFTVGGTGPVVTGPTVEVFTRSRLTVGARYERSNGTQLRGIAPIHLASDLDTGGSTAEADQLVTGARPHSLALSSALASQTQAILVRDGSAISGVGGLTDETLARGRERCAEQLEPLGVSARSILGTRPTRPRASLSGAAVVLGPSARSLGLCLEGFAAGSTTVQVTWGTGTVTRSWTVTP